jgi:hypothetical protein
MTLFRMAADALDWILDCVKETLPDWLKAFLLVILVLNVLQGIVAGMLYLVLAGIKLAVFFS